MTIASPANNSFTNYYKQQFYTICNFIKCDCIVLNPIIIIIMQVSRLERIYHKVQLCGSLIMVSHSVRCRCGAVKHLEHTGQQAPRTRIEQPGRGFRRGTLGLGQCRTETRDILILLSIAYYF